MSKQNDMPVTQTREGMQMSQVTSEGQVAVVPNVVDSHTLTGLSPRDSILVVRSETLSARNGRRTGLHVADGQHLEDGEIRGGVLPMCILSKKAT